MTVDDLRDAGLDEADYPDEVVEPALALAHEAIDRLTRQWFEPRELTAVYDGNNSDMIALPVPIIEVTALYINDSTEPLDPSLYRVYNGRALPDDRRNPRIHLLGGGSGRPDIFTAPFGSDLRFHKGRQNTRIEGTFGFVEPDESTPLLIKRATAKLALQKMGALVQGAADVPAAPPLPPVAAAIISETTDDHSYKTAETTRAERRAGYSGLLAGDTEIEDVVTLYKGPKIVMVSGSSWSWR